MPTDLPIRALDFSDAAQQASYIDDAFAAGDPFLVTLALKHVGAAQGVPVALDENPPLGEVLRVLADLRLETRVERAGARTAASQGQKAPGQV